MSGEEEEEEAKVGRPNLYWQQQREADTFSAAFRGVPAPPRHGTTPPEAIGSMEYCWCGLPNHHDWPGKKSGLPHPKEEKAVTAMAVERAPLNRRDLRAYHSKTVELILALVNSYGIDYRLSDNAIILYHPDRSKQNCQIPARNSDRNLKRIEKWAADVIIASRGAFVKDVEVMTDEVDLAIAKTRLAEKMNGPEHPVPEREVKVEMKEEPEEVEVEETEEPPEWIPFISARNGTPNENFEMRPDRSEYRCTHCGETNSVASGIVGHWRTHHSDTDTLWGSEAKARAAETSRFYRLTDKVSEAIEILSVAIGQGDPAEVERLTAENKRLAAENKELRASCADSEATRARLEEVEAKLALIKETMSL